MPTINPLNAQPLLLHVIAKQLVRNAKSAGHGKAYRWLHGLTLDKLQTKYGVFLSTDNSVLSEDGQSFSCVFKFCKIPDSANSIIFKEVSGILKAFITGPLVGAIGGPVKSAYDMYGQCGDIESAGSVAAGAFSKKARRKGAQKVYSRLNGAWQSGTWTGAQGTGQEGAVASWYGLIAAGPAHLELQGTKLLITFRTEELDTIGNQKTSNWQSFHARVSGLPAGGKAKMIKNYARTGARWELDTATGKLS